jgi:hypothetical protein
MRVNSDGEGRAGVVECTGAGGKVMEGEILRKVLNAT